MRKNTYVNGSKSRLTIKARQRIVKLARRKGYITNEQAKKTGKFNQVWYHLAALEKEGFIKHDGYNNWIPVRGLKRAYG